MEITEKKDTENNTNNSNNNAQTTLDSASLENIDKEAEERQARDLKAGLHPLKVLSFALLCVYLLFNSI